MDEINSISTTLEEQIGKITDKLKEKEGELKGCVTYSSEAHFLSLEDSSVKFKSDLDKINELRVTKKNLEREHQQISKNVGEILEESVEGLQEKKAKFREEVEALMARREKLEEEKKELKSKKFKLEEELKSVAQEIGGMETDLQVWVSLVSLTGQERKRGKRKIRQRNRRFCVWLQALRGLWEQTLHRQGC